jgi:hypothetical protein
MTATPPVDYYAPAQVRRDPAGQPLGRPGDG